MRVRRFATALGAIALLTVGRSSIAQTTRDEDQTERPEVRSLTLSGVRSVDRDELNQSIVTSASRCQNVVLTPFCLVTRSDRFWDKKYLDRIELRRDVLRIRVFYWKRGYREAQVDTVVADRGDDEVGVTFKIDEGRPTLTRVVRVTQTDTVLSDAEAARVVELEVGKAFNLLALDSTVAKMRDVLQDRGYADARVDTSTSVDTAAHVADVTISVDPRSLTFVGQILIDGTKDVSDRTIRNSLSFKTGDLFKRRELSASQRRLYESGLFQRAAITARRFRDSTAAEARMRDSLRDAPTDRARDSLRAVFMARRPPDSVRTVDVTVNEAPQRVFRVTGGFNTFDFVQADGTSPPTSSARPRSS
jgi:outer membrane protein assembly factor BamA